MVSPLQGQGEIAVWEWIHTATVIATALATWPRLRSSVSLNSLPSLSSFPPHFSQAKLRRERIKKGESIDDISDDEPEAE